MVTDVALQSERAFRAMGSDAHVLVWSSPDLPIEPEDLLDAAEAEIARLEGRWSRFREDSDISRLNAAGGAPVAVAPETIEVLDLALVASQRTGGRFDPLILPALLTAGYDRSFDRLTPPVAGAEHHGAPAITVPPGVRPRATTAGDLVIDPVAGTVRLARGAAVDLGGIGKGRAADLVAATLVDLGATAACVNLGGDLGVLGAVPGGGVLVGVEDPFGGADLALWSIRDAGVATSSRLRRRWNHDGLDAHHLIDPATGRPATTDVLACTVVADSGAWADVLAKLVLLAPLDEAAAVLADVGAAALVVHGGGRVTTLGSPPEHVGTDAP